MDFHNFLRQHHFSTLRPWLSSLDFGTGLAEFTGMDRPIRPLLRRKPVILPKETTIRQAARILNEQSTDTLLIADRDKGLLGIVTPRDLACRAILGKDTSSRVITEIMSRKPFVMKPDGTVEQALRIMEKHAIRRIPIIEILPNGRTRCLGILTLDDLLAAEAGTPDQLAQAARRQTSRSQNSRRRSEAHRTQSLRIFFKRMAGAMELPEETAEWIIRSVLTALVQRLSTSGAAHLLAQLPARLQQDLLTLPPGPDRSITPGWLLESLNTRLHLPPDGARRIVIEAFSAITEFLDPGEVEHLKSQLPEEFAPLFIGNDRASSKLQRSQAA